MIEAEFLDWVVKEDYWNKDYFSEEIIFKQI